ncbi:MAG: methionyl-tRNA formyltransferase [Gemmatimonadales bacterium]
MLQILLVGQEAAGAQILRSLIASTHRVVAVLTDEPKSLGESASLAAPAAKAGLRVLPARSVREPGFASVVREHEVDLLLNVHSLHIVADAVLAAPRIGAFNLHPGPLPAYAGLNTPGWAIYNGETEYGVTVHWMEPGIDTGPIAFEERFPMPAKATPLSLAAECSRRGVALLQRLIDCAQDDPTAIPRKPQDLSARAYYARAGVPQDGHVDWRRPAEQIARLSRAFDYAPFVSPWGRPTAVICERRVEVSRLEPTGVVADLPAGSHRVVDGSLRVACADEWIDVGHVFVDGARVSGSRLTCWVEQTSDVIRRRQSTQSDPNAGGSGGTRVTTTARRRRRRTGRS